MSQIHKHPVPENIAANTLITAEQYQAMYQQSVDDPDSFWGEQGKILDWIKPYSKVKIARLHQVTLTFAGTKMARSTWRQTALTVI